jgi:type I restriction enzyme M protein
MIGAIIGDIVGSRFEYRNHRSKEFDLFTEECFVTDDSIMTLAIAKAIMETIKRKSKKLDAGFYQELEKMTVKYMQEIGRKYPNCGFGYHFYNWVFDSNPQPYNSFGNGSAMRVSPVVKYANSENEVIELAKTVTAVTHNHEEGIKGAVATALAIYLAKNGASKTEIKERIIRDYYVLDFDLKELQKTYIYDVTCMGTVPQSIFCFLEANDFEDAIRTAISIGGDSDTLTAITGSIAEAYYGVPEALKEKSLTYLNNDLMQIYLDWENLIL